MSGKLTEAKLFELGRLGESVASIALKLDLPPMEFHQLLSQRPEMMRAHKMGLQVYHDTYRVSMVPHIKEAFMERIKAGDTKAIIWGMDNMVMVASAHPSILDTIPVSLKGTEAEQKLPPANEEERRARVDSLLAVLKTANAVN